MQSNQQAREQKQKYLRQQVLEKGYDADQFVEYLSNVAMLSADIDSITFSQLKTVVTGFTKQKAAQSGLKKTASTQQKTILDNYEIATSKIQDKSAKPKIILYEKYGNPPVEQLEFQKTFKCIKIKQKNNCNIPKIQVSDPIRESSGGFFGIGSVSYLMFKIQTFDFKWEVRRRYSDFQWLRAIISKFFPTYIIPPIPKKNAKKRTARDLQKRMRILSYFLNDIASISEIFNSKYVQGFMSITSLSKFEQLKQQADNKDSSQSITSVQTPTGLVTVKLDTERKIYSQQIQKFLNGAEVIYKQVTTNSKLLQSHLIEQTNTLYTMGNLFADLSTLITDFNTRLPNCKQNILSDTYITLNNMTVQWGNIIKNQHAYIEKNFNTFFRYIRNEIYSVKEMLTKVQQIQSEYFKRKIILDKKKEKIFSLNDVSKWEIPSLQAQNLPNTIIKNKAQSFKIMLPKESLQMEKAKIKYAFYMSQLFEHSSSCLQRGSTRYCQNFKEFAIKIKVNTQQLTQLWTQIATNFADPKKKIAVVEQLAQKQDQYEDG